MNNIGIIILAAGKSRRFHHTETNNSDKRLARLSSGLTLLQSTLSNIPASFTQRILVLRPGDEELSQQFTSSWDICIAQDSELGMGSSLANAINASIGWQGAIIGLGDMPFIKPSTYATLQKELVKHDIIFPTFKEKRGNPVAFSSKYFTELSHLKGDTGARTLLKKYASNCYKLACNDAGILQDIDTSEDLTISTPT